MTRLTCVFLLTGFLLLSATGTMFGGNGIWGVQPDTPVKDKNSVENYFKTEKARLESSLAVLDKRGIVIIPTPKNINLQDEKSDLKVGVAELARQVVIVDAAGKATVVDWVQKELRRLGADSYIPVIPASSWDGSANNQIIVLLMSEDKAVASKDPTETNLPRVPQGYAIASRNSANGRIYVLTGHDDDGLLYAAVTFSKLLTCNKSVVSFPEMEISDWPDVRYRCVGGLEWAFRRCFWEKQSADPEEGKRYIDWAVAHKINMISGVSSNDPYSVIGHPRFRTPAMRSWLKAVNTYAMERGVRVILPQTFAVGVSQTDKDKPELKDAIDHRGGLFEWSNDDLIDSKAAELNSFLTETGYSGIYFHSLDTRNSRWQDSSPASKARFNDDRFNADANLINRLYSQLRQEHPELFFIIVPRPYMGNLDKPEPLINRGEMKAPDDMKRFSGMLPEDIYLCKRESNPEEHRSWTDLKQPLYLYVSYDESDILLSGRTISPMFRYSKTFFQPLGRDVLFYCSTWPQADVMNIGAIEYSWNLNMPGNAEYLVPNYLGAGTGYEATMRDLWDAFGEKHERNPELQYFIHRACADLYGREWAQYFFRTFISFLDWNLIYDTQNLCNNFLKPAGFPCDKTQCLNWLKRIAADSAEAIDDLEKIDRAGNPPAYTRQAATYFLSRLYLIHAGAAVLAPAYAAEVAARNKDYTQAQKYLRLTDTVYTEQVALLQKKWPELIRHPSLRSLDSFKTMGAPLLNLKSITDLIKIKVESQIEMGKKPGPSVKKTETAITAAKNTPLLIALFNPNTAKGQAYGLDGIRHILSGQLDLQVTEISDLTLKNLKKYNVAIIPDCKKFGTAKFSLNDLRKYVMNYGGGVYMEHDSCGSPRFPLQSSAFPEIAEFGKQVGGVTPGDSKYKEEERRLRVTARHPVTAGILPNREFRQIYYDHMQLTPASNTKVLVTDCYGKPVVVCGESGTGRVIFNGGLCYQDNDRELTAAPPGPEGKIILDAIRWLGRRDGSGWIKLSQLQKKDTVLADATYSLISFRPEINVPVKLTDTVLTVQCFNPVNDRSILPETEIAKPGTITGSWQAQNVELKLDEYAAIELLITLRSREGVLQFRQLLQSKE